MPKVPGPDLFADAGDRDREQSAPLPWRLRPLRLDELAGQDHLTGTGGVLRNLLEHRLRSAIFYGPAGTGKTTAAKILAGSGKMRFVSLSAIDSGAADLRRTAEAARQSWANEGRGTVLFVDEIHRFNKGQQDVLLPFVEDGTVVLVGATTENPWAALNSALVSRCLLVQFHALSEQSLVTILDRAWSRRAEWWHSGSIDQEVFNTLAQRSAGDARLALTLLERVAWLADANGTNHITVSHVNQVWQDSAHYHDTGGDRHYDITSAFIKSIRGSDPDAALYWMGRLLAGGDDPRYIVRRILVHAAEDIGLADPQALTVAAAAWTALNAVGLPEARIPIAEAVIYLAGAPKSNSVVAALERLDNILQRWPNLEVPDHLRDRHYRPDIDEPYHYPHDSPGHFTTQRYRPPELDGIAIYQPSDQGQENDVKQRLNHWWPSK
ncbi:MAG: replication-associated recombination protein A [Sulfobacillus benefaciens]|uniref:Replication-associated recombination protein A n=1 Tax=Sulfobacillus benefaciens TaxID=453960 RepID=A0A2T2XHX3_9FIRM|nr:MAG: replication-associated recombination protein A [Sulfobacillus benefaciens]